MAQIKQTSQPTSEQEIELLKQRLVDAQKSAALGELLGTTTHEFNNVLMTIINYAKMGIRHNDEATRDKALAKILAAGERAAKITNTVLAMARNRSVDFEPTNLQQIIEESLLLLERELQKYRISVDKQFSPVPEVMACGNQVQQVLLNLLINARQAMSNGGNLILRLSHDDATGMVDLLVRDSGKGISPDKLPQIFDPYFTTKNGPDATGRGGTGLGLSSCREIIETHRGRIRVESKVGVGTAFTIRLPVARSISPTPTSVPHGAVATELNTRLNDKAAS